MDEKNQTFWINPNYDMTQIVDSMQIDSEETIATMHAFGVKASLEVRGDVKIWWNPEKGKDPLDGKYYKYPSEFPEDLKNLIAKGVTNDDQHWSTDPRLYISENNWFEIFIGDENRGYDCSICVDVEGMTPDEIKDMLLDICKEYTDNCNTKNA